MANEERWPAFCGRRSLSQEVDGVRDSRARYAWLRHRNERRCRRLDFDGESLECGDGRAAARHLDRAAWLWFELQRRRVAVRVAMRVAPVGVCLPVRLSLALAVDAGDAAHRLAHVKHDAGPPCRSKRDGQRQSYEPSLHDVPSVAEVCDFDAELRKPLRITEQGLTTRACRRAGSRARER